MNNLAKHIDENEKLSELLAEIAYTFNAISGDMFDVSMENVLSILGLHLDISRVFILEKDLSYEKSICSFEWQKKEPGNNLPISKLTTIAENKVWDRAILEKGYFVCNNTKFCKKQEMLNFFEQQHIKSVLIFPLFVKNKYFGSLTFSESEKEKEWTAKEINSLRTVSHLFADAYNRKLTEKELRYKEEKYRTLFENAQDAYFILNNFKIIDTNIAARKLFKKTEKELTGLDFTTFIKENNSEAQKDEQHIIDYAKEALRGENRKFNWKFYLENDNVLETEVHLSRFYQQNEYFLLVVIRDLTLSKQHENDLHEHMQKLEEVNKTKDRFFSIIAHDLKNPFNSLLGITENLYQNLEDFTTEELKEYLSLLLHSSQQGYNLLENLLHWSRSQTGTLKVNAKIINLNELIDSVINLLKNNSSEKEIAVRNNVEFNILAFADENMIKTVIRNLLSNAIKFTPNTGEININAEKKDREILVSVIDNGVGMSEEVKNNLFKLDVFNSTPGTNQETGTGLGVILCKEFVEKNKGKIWVESEPNFGTVFHFTIPRA